MLISKLQYRVIFIAAILGLIVLGLLYRSYPDVPYRFTHGYGSSEPNGESAVEEKPLAQKSWLYAGPKAQDKAVIMARIHTEDVSWAYEQLSDWKLGIYHMDNETENGLHPPRNKGREAMAYLSFIIDHYENLPAYMVFVHPHLKGWPEAWHTDSDDHDQVKSIQSLRLEYLDKHGYANMRCIHDPGCPAEIQVDRQDDHRTAEHAMREAWPYMFGGNYSDIPKKIAQPCCSQFAISKAQTMERPKSDYELYRKWLLETPLDDATSGRVFEYLWQVIFGQDAVYCPSLRQCWCEQFGRC
jgi:hypothetical protein